LEKAPDIVFLPRRLEYFGFGEYEFGSHKIIESMRRGISGTHRMNGIFMAYGAAIRPGAVVENASLYDLAPTILRLMDEPVADPMDGRVLEEVLTPDVAGALAQRRAARTNGKNGAGGKGYGPEAMSAEDKKVLADRLRSLGYVG
jgi:hypothetical protein